MKSTFTLIVLFIFCLSLEAQTPITAVTLNTVPSASSFTYVVSANIYNWGLAPNNSTSLLTGLTAGSETYSLSSVPGTVNIRRVNNVNTQGIYTLVWAEGSFSGASFNLFPAYENDMDVFFNNQIYNQGADNFFDNISANSNNVERLDYTFVGSYSTTTPGQMGFPVFDRGDIGAHDPFVIAAVTSLDGSGKPASYGKIVRVTAADYGDPGPNLTYRVVKNQYPANLADAGSNTQSRGGVFISLADLGIAPGQLFFGYSILSSDLPGAATPLDLIDYTNSAFYPLNTGYKGGLDMVAVTGLYVSNVVLPTRFTGFAAVNLADKIDLKWTVENDNTVKSYEIERSSDGINFSSIQVINSGGGSIGNKAYSTVDNVSSLSSKIFYYRIRQLDFDGSMHFSKIISVRITGITSVVSIFPNPVKRHLFLNYNSSSNSSAIISVLNASGAKVLRQRENIFSGNNSISIDGVANLSRGLYLISIEPGNGSHIIKKFTKL